MRERIEAWLRIRDAARWKREARGAADDIRDIGDAADEANTGVEGLSAQSGVLSGSLSDLLKGTGLVRLGLGGLGSVAAVALPTVVALGGAVVALAASATLAAGGLGILAGGGLAILLAGLLPLVVLVKGLTENFKKIKTAQDAYNLAVSTYGVNSKQADSALKKLKGTTDEFGGISMFNAVKKVEEFGHWWKKLTTPAMKEAVKTLDSVLNSGKKLGPVLAMVTNMSAKAVGGPLRALMRTLSSPVVQIAILGLAAAFTKLSPLLGHIVGNLLVGFLMLALKASPYVLDLAHGIEELSARFSDWAASPGASKLFATMIEHTKAWWGLLKSVGGLLVSVLGGGAEEGKGMVESLTTIVNKWNDWLRSAEGQKAMKDFFHDAVGFTKELLRVVVPLVVILFSLGRALMGPVGGGFHLLGTVLGPVAWGITKLTPVLGFLATNLMGPVGSLGRLRKAFEWIRDNGGGVFNSVKDGISSAVRWIVDRLREFVGFLDRVKDKIESIPGVKTALSVGKFAVGHRPDVLAAKGVVKGGKAIAKLVGGATGGVFKGPGSFLTGESGPEINTFDGRRVSVAPLRSASVSGRGTVRAIDPELVPGGGDRTIIVPVQLNGREIARAVAEDTDDRLARR